MPSEMQRRSFLRLALVGIGGVSLGVPLSACGAGSPSDAAPDPTRGPRPARAGGGGRILLAYFSRPGENYWNGGRRDLKVGANPLPSIVGYDTILLASPIWNITAPMIMSTFAESYDFSGKTVHPVTTHAMSGLGTTREDYALQCRGRTHRHRIRDPRRRCPVRRDGRRRVAASSTPARRLRRSRLTPSGSPLLQIRSAPPAAAAGSCLWSSSQQRRYGQSGSSPRCPFPPRSSEG
jgi:hypothetical protein